MERLCTKVLVDSSKERKIPRYVPDGYKTFANKSEFSISALSVLISVGFFFLIFS